VWLLGFDIKIFIWNTLAYFTNLQILKIFYPSSHDSFILTGNIEAGLPPFQSPSFSINDTTTGEEIGLGGMVYNLGSAIIVIPLISILANVAIAKSFCKSPLNGITLNTITDLVERNAIDFYIIIA